MSTGYVGRKENTYLTALNHMTNTQRHTKYVNSTNEYIIIKKENTIYEKYSHTLKNRVKLQ